EPAEHREVYGKEFPPREPHVAAEHGHPGPRERRVAEHGQGQRAWDLALAPRQLHGGETEQEDRGRRDPPAWRIGRERLRGRVAPASQVVDSGPRVYDRPEIPDEGRQIGKPNPPEDPDGDWCDVPEGPLRAEQSGGDQNGEHG